MDKSSSDFISNLRFRFNITYEYISYYKDWNVHKKQLHRKKVLLLVANDVKDI